MSNQVRQRFTVRPSDLYQRKPNIVSGVVQSDDTVEVKVRKLVESGFCSHLPFNRRVEKIANGLFRTKDRDMETGLATRTTQYVAFERRVAQLVQEFEEQQAELPETD